MFKQRFARISIRNTFTSCRSNPGWPMPQPWATVTLSFAYLRGCAQGRAQGACDLALTCAILSWTLQKTQKHSGRRAVEPWVVGLIPPVEGLRNRDRRLQRTLRDDHLEGRALLTRPLFFTCTLHISMLPRPHIPTLCGRHQSCQHVKKYGLRTVK